MSTPEDNPDGYRETAVIRRVSGYPTKVGAGAGAGAGVGAGAGSGSEAGVAPVMLKITHGTGDDNVHFQNTLQLIDVLHRQGSDFEFMIYPDGMHGYRGYQGAHFQKANQDFWLKYLKD
jgi:dipeptidyl-peptidase-4